MPTNNKSKQDKFNEALNFAQTYYDSKGFNERFEKAKSLLPKGFILHKTTFKAPKLKIVDKNNAYYNPNDNTIEYGMIADFNPLFHEFGHKIDHSIHLDKKNYPNWLFRKTPFRYSYSSIYPVFYRNKNLKSNDVEIRKSPLQDRKQNRLEHDSQPQESYADLMNLRYHLYNSGIYDSTKANNPFTQDHIDKLKEQFDFSLPENHGINRLFQNFNEKDIIEMMNTVAQNKYNDDQLQYARKGAKLISRKQGGLIPKFKNSGKAERNLLKETKVPGASVRKRVNGIYWKPTEIGSTRYRINVPRPMNQNGLFVGVPYATDEPNAHDRSRPFQEGKNGSVVFDEDGSYNEIPLSNKSHSKSADKSAKQNPGTKGSAKGGRKSGKTTLPPAGTASPTDLSKMNGDWLKARNDAMTRGYRDYFYNGQRYSFTGEDLTNAQNNWRINRGRPISRAKGLLGLPTQLTGETVAAKPLTETFSDPNAPKETTIPADYFTHEMLTQALRNKWIANSRQRAIPVEKIEETSYNKPSVIHFGADRNWNGMTDEQKLNYLQTMDKAIDPNDETLSIYDTNGNQVLNQSENSSFGPLTLSELYNADKGAFNDYMNNFRGKAWDTATDEGSKTYKGMLDYYNQNRKAVDKYAKKQKWQANSPEVFNYLYTQYNNTLPKARKGTKLIPRNNGFK